ncbi:MAG TPA: LysM peptidoglycan-binding domain-containing M23 family metallopeptidase, partial [Desulfobacteria bacterium]|nr:LysM peptidoglycan-binding domain-containing M23 family metallopeptidase [Desulfobacteria bacterium]
ELLIPEGNRVAYTVAPGDTLWSLAKKFNTTIEAMVRENGSNIMETLIADRKITVPANLDNFDGGQFAVEKPERAKLADENSTALSGSSIPQLSNWPVQGPVSSAFGRRWGRMHKGIDIAAETGEPIRAVADGIVAFSGDRGTYGNSIIINHGDGFRSQYAHASKLLVTLGQRVERGQVIARVGNTGRSTGPHLHLELLYKGQPVDPENYLPDRL